eukprot:TRINITY_DN525_c0_g1_i1.p1 TRINITY_DN525_c0_g1~~TRINITY_DN525_c0_g1_i1.p1  ORF type:complete len:166 (+),score=68.25 TRINITY_DN525_c0_g1_i1:362-859(+)
MKAYFDRTYPGGEYDAVERRKNSKGGTTKSTKTKSTTSTTTAKSSRNTNRSTNVNSSANTSTRSTKALSSKQRTQQAKENQKQEANAKLEQLNTEVTELKLTVDMLERERDFYYNKLREVEILCQKHTDENNSVVAEIEQVLYSADDDEQAQENDEQVLETEITA